MMNELGTDKITIDPESGQRFVYVGAGMSDTEPQSVIAYSPTDAGGVRAVLHADGSVDQLSSAKFVELVERGVIRSAGAVQIAQNRIASGGAGNPTNGVPAGAAVTRAGGTRSIRIDIPR